MCPVNESDHTSSSDEDEEIPMVPPEPNPQLIAERDRLKAESEEVDKLLAEVVRVKRVWEEAVAQKAEEREEWFRLKRASVEEPEVLEAQPEAPEEEDKSGPSCSNPK